MTLFQLGFSPELELIEVTPVYKKKDPLNKEKYCPVSVSSYVSKIFERINYEQINSYIEPRFFRENHNTQQTLVKIIGKWKSILNKGCTIGAIFMDLPKAFDKINHKLI